MSYLFRADTVLYNAFFALGGSTDFLSHDDIHAFCAMIDSNIKQRIDSSKQSNSVVFDMRMDMFASSDDVRFVDLGDTFANLGGRVTEDDISFINCHIESNVVLSAIERARADFQRYKTSGGDDASVRESVRRTTII